jgi:hypothetical protein
MTAGDETLRYDNQAGGNVGPDFERHGFKVPGAGCRLRSSSQPVRSESRHVPRRPAELHGT